jgi:hypothetical protein
MLLPVHITLATCVKMQSAISAQRPRENNGTVACISIIRIPKSGRMALMLTGVHVESSQTIERVPCGADTSGSLYDTLDLRGQHNSSY